MVFRIPANSLLVISLVLAGQCFAAEQDYAARFKELQEQKADAQIEPLLNEWREKMPNDPDAWITSANYYFNQRQVMLSTKKPGKGDFSLKDAKTGKQAGSISFEQQGDSVKHAAELLQQATTKFPDRVDIWCGLAFIYQESGDFENELSILRKMVAYAREHPAQLKWLKGAPLEEPADKFVPEKLHSYGLYYAKKATPPDEERFLTIASFAAEQFPNHPSAFNDVGGIYGERGDLKKAREWFEKSNRVDPKDMMVVANLGNVCAELGDAASARKWYQQVLDADPNGEYAQEAKEGLGKLKKK
jgi:tetratricopeptide (TPR) repeat protein